MIQDRHLFSIAGDKRLEKSHVQLSAKWNAQSCDRTIQNYANIVA